MSVGYRRGTHLWAQTVRGFLLFLLSPFRQNTTLTRGSSVNKVTNQMKNPFHPKCRPFIDVQSPGGGWYTAPGSF